MFTSTAEAPPQKWRMRTRRLVLVDIENMIGGAVRDSDSVVWAKQQFDYQRVIPVVRATAQAVGATLNLA